MITGRHAGAAVIIENEMEVVPLDREWNLGLGVGIWALRVGFGPQDWDLGLETGIWASRLRYGPEGWGEGGVEEEEEKKEKTPHMCESIGHRPLRGRCPAPPQLQPQPT